MSHLPYSQEQQSSTVAARHLHCDQYWQCTHMTHVVGLHLARYVITEPCPLLTSRYTHWCRLQTIRLECRPKFVSHARTALRLGFRSFCPTPRQASRCGCHKSYLVPQVSSLLRGVLASGTCPAAFVPWHLLIIL